MTDTNWPTEAALTAATEAIARAVYSEETEMAREAYPPGTTFATWEELHPAAHLARRNRALPLVMTVFESIPDPRHVAWEEGYVAGSSDGAFEESGTGADDVVYPHLNPYQSGL